MADIQPTPETLRDYIATALHNAFGEGQEFQYSGEHPGKTYFHDEADKLLALVTTQNKETNNERYGL